MTDFIESDLYYTNKVSMYAALARLNEPPWSLLGITAHTKAVQIGFFRHSALRGDRIADVAHGPVRRYDRWLVSLVFSPRGGSRQNPPAASY